MVEAEEVNFLPFRRQAGFVREEKKTLTMSELLKLPVIQAISSYTYILEIKYAQELDSSF